ncbi:unnamed protein product [Durusdinium trenchii]
MVTKVLPISDHYEPGGNFFLDEERDQRDDVELFDRARQIDARDRRESLDGLLSTQSIDSDNAGANLPRLESFEGSSLLEPGGAVVPAGAAGGADPDRGGTAAFVARGVDGRGARKPKASLLLLVVIALWIVDLVFAMDSVASKLATVNDLYLNVASAAFAMMGLRSLYFLMESLVQSFHMLKYGIAAILVLIGLKMVFSVWFEISNSVTFVLIIAICIASAVSSYWLPSVRQSCTALVAEEDNLETLPEGDGREGRTSFEEVEELEPMTPSRPVAMPVKFDDP